MTSSSPPPASQNHSGFGYLYAAMALFLVLLVILLWSAGAGQAQSTAPPRSVETVTTATVTIQKGFTVPTRVRGLVESSQSARLSFDVAGSLVSLHADEGEAVTRGQLLASLDTARLTARQRELNATLDRANANARLAQLSMSRIDDLVKQKLESSQRQDEASAQLSAANAQVRETEAALAAIDVEIEKSRLYAPFDGEITARFVDEGTTLTPGMAIFALSNNSQLQARFALPASDVHRFSRDQTVRVEVAGRTLDATVTQRVAQRRTQTRTVDILVTFPPSAALLPGDMAEMVLSRERAEHGAWVPVTALSNGLRGLWTVFVLNDDTDDDGAQKVTARSVEVVYTDGERAFVQGALRDGETYVRGGTHKLSPGQWVVTHDKAANISRAGGQ